MLYISRFEFPDVETETDFRFGLKMTCYDSIYPFGVLSEKGLTQLDFEDITLLCGGTMPEKQIFRDFHDELFEGYRASLHSENALLCHMKELWSYMGGIFEDSEKCVKRIRKAGSAAAYRAAVSDIFALPLQNA